MKLSVVGLGKLGLCTAAFFASRGFQVAGYDNNRELVGQLAKGDNPIDEPGLSDLLVDAQPNLAIVKSIKEAVVGSDITLVIVPTPSGKDGFFSNSFVCEVLREVGAAIAVKSGYHIVDVVSTVMPGSSVNTFVPLLESSSKKKCGTDFGFVYNPEFIALGTVIKDFSSPDMVLIGASDERAGEVVAKIYRKACLNSPPICEMSLINAEICKLSLNCFVTMKISFANELARICEKIEGADVDAITSALGCDTRIGNKYLKGGMGFGGPCFPRDNVALSAFAQSLGYRAKLSQATQQINQQVIDTIEKKIKAHISSGRRVTLLGMAYKAGAPIIEASQSIDLAHRLIKEGFKLTVSDPVALESVKRILRENVRYQENPYRAAEGADAVVLLTPWPQYSELNWEEIGQQVKTGSLLLDCWRVVQQNKLYNFHYEALGKCV